MRLLNRRSLRTRLINVTRHHVLCFLVSISFCYFMHSISGLGYLQSIISPVSLPIYLLHHYTSIESLSSLLLWYSVILSKIYHIYVDFGKKYTRVCV